MKKREMFWVTTDDRSVLKRERLGQRCKGKLYAPPRCMRFASIGTVWSSIEGWKWDVAPEGPITLVAGIAKSEKAAKLAVETVLRVLEGEAPAIRPQRVTKLPVLPDGRKVRFNKRTGYNWPQGTDKLTAAYRNYSSSTFRDDTFRDDSGGTFRD